MTSPLRNRTKFAYSVVASVRSDGPKTPAFQGRVPFGPRRKVSFRTNSVCSSSAPGARRCNSCSHGVPGVKYSVIPPGVGTGTIPSTSATSPGALAATRVRTTARSRSATHGASSAGTRPVTVGLRL